MNETVTAQQSRAQHILRLRRLNARLATRVRRLTRDLAQARLSAHHDPLTGLPNRSLLFDRLAQATAQSARHGRPVLLVVVDLDGFKRVNDSYGHRSGDELLQQVAARLLACVRSCDTVCRYGGDEFIIVIPQIDASTGADIVSDKIKARLAAPYMLDGRGVAVTASIGTAVSCGQNSRELIDVADAAMYLDKTQRGVSERCAAMHRAVAARAETRERLPGIPGTPRSGAMVAASGTSTPAEAKSRIEGVATQATLRA